MEEGSSTMDGEFPEVAGYQGFPACFAAFATRKGEQLETSDLQIRKRGLRERRLVHANLGLEWEGSLLSGNGA